jgi:WD40-like Beta Propeller Repeat
MNRTVPIAAAAAVAALAAVAPLSAGAARPQAPAGAIVFTSVRSNDGRELYVVNRDGSGLRRLTFNTLFERQAAWSPDRTQVAFSAADSNGNFDIYLINADGSSQQRLTADPAADQGPQWTSDGRIVFQRDSRAWVMNADGTNAAELATGAGDAVTPTASPHGDEIAFASSRGGATYAIYVMHENGKALKQVTQPAAGQDVQPRFSPDGKQLTFIRDNGTPDNDLYVVGENGKGLRQLTATPNRIEFWSSWSGDDVVFSARDAAFNWHLYSVPSTGGPETNVSTIPQAPYVDSFDHGVVDTSFWYVLQDPGSSISVSNGEAVASISGSAVPGPPFNQVATGIGSPCHTLGDFDYQVDYRLLTWPAHGGFFAQLQSVFGWINASRQSAPWDPPYNQQYGAWTGGDTFQFNSINTVDTAGSLRVQRIGSTVYAYERGVGEPWNLFFTGRNQTGEGIPQLTFSASADNFAHQDGSVAYDNFRLNSGPLTCPSWWQDFAPDAG